MRPSLIYSQVAVSFAVLLVLVVEACPVSCYLEGTTSCSCSDEGLLGVWPAGLATTLTHLDLNSNDLTLVPTQIGNLTALTSLYLYENQLNALPPQIGDLTALNRLYLYGNQLNAIPSQIGNLTALTSLLLQGNQLNSLPSQIAKLESLESLPLGHNQFYTVPSEILDLSALARLDLKNNQLNTIPAQIAKLTLLTLLDLSYNELTAVPPQIGELTALFDLDLEYNQLKALPSQIGQLTSVVFLKFNNNQLDALPTQIGQMTLVNFWSVNDNQLLAVPTEIGMLTLLLQLDLSNNQLNILPSQIGKLTRLNFLELYNNQLPAVPPQIGEFINLFNLELYNNQLNAVPSQIGKLTSLIGMYLENNELTVFPTQVGRLSRLTKLFLSSNQLNTVPSQIGHLTLLDELYLDGNSLTAVPSQIGDLSSLVGLRLGEVDCECELLSWYSPFTDNALFNLYDVAICSGTSSYGGFYPHLLKVPDGEGPCTYVKISEEYQSGLTTIDLLWTYEYTSDMDLSPSLINMNDETESFASCDIITIDSVQSSNTIGAFGFQISWAINEEQESSMCVFAADLATYQIASTRYFDYTIENLNPATEYTITVRPFRTQVLNGNRFSAVFGIDSLDFFANTADGVPSDSPQDLTFDAADDTSLTLTWNNPNIPNGEILEYNVELNGSEPEYTTQNSISFRSLRPNTNYSVRARARTSASDFGPWSEWVDVATCQSGTRTEDAQTPCFAITGRVLTLSGISLSCSDFGEAIDTSQCLGNRGIDISELTLNRDYWRGSAESLLIRKCPLASSCTGGNTTGEASCTPSNTGPLCAVCVGGSFYNGNECVDCANNDLENWIRFLVVLIIICTILLVLLYLCWRGLRISIDSESATKFKILFTTYQVILTFSWTLELVFPSAIASFLDLVTWLNLDITEIVPQWSCAVGSSYLIDLITITVPPLIIALPAFFILLCVKKDKWRRRSIEFLVILSFLVYTPVTNKVVRALRPCDDDFDDGRSYMPEDYNVECSSEAFTLQVLPTGWFMLCSYCIGVPIAYSVVLWQNRKAIDQLIQLELHPQAIPGDDSGEATEVANLRNELAYISFLYSSYSLWWWEIVEVVRKFTFSGFIVFVSPGSPEQSILLMVLTLFSTMLYQYFTPFRGTENLLAILASYTLFFIAFASLLIKFEPGYLQSSFFDVVFLVILISPLILALGYSRAILAATRQALGCTDPTSDVSFNEQGRRVVPVEALVELKKQNSKLTNENEKLKQKVLEYKESEKENKELKQMLSEYKESEADWLQTKNALEAKISDLLKDAKVSI